MSINDRPTMEDIRLEKQRLQTILNEIEADAMKLISRIDKARIELENTQTADDVCTYNENNDLEKGLIHIKLV